MDDPKGAEKETVRVGGAASNAVQSKMRPMLK